MSLKASVNGPNRRKQKNLESSWNNEGQIYFPIRKIEGEFTNCANGAEKKDTSLEEFGDCCFFNPNGAAGKSLIRRHAEMTGNASETMINSEDPILIHFHEVPVFILRAIPVPDSLTHKLHDNEDFLLISRVQGHINKVCVDTVMAVTCCSRPKDQINYDPLSLVGIEVYIPKTGFVHHQQQQLQHHQHIVHDHPLPPKKFNAKDISRQLMNRTFRSILTINELQVVCIDGTDIACRISAVRIRTSESDNSSSMTSAEASMEEPYRGRVMIDTEFYITPSSDDLTIVGSKVIPEGKLPDDVIHITTTDLEWFPVRRVLLAPCIKLTKYVQAGRGKYTEIPSLSEKERSPDAPSADEDSCPHCKVPVDCCTFDRVLLFIMSLLYPEKNSFQLDNSEVNSMADAAEKLGLMPLSDLCEAKNSSFDSRVRRHEFIRFAEVEKRNNHGELLIILDGMVLDITRWLDEHPGGPSIIPSQALNIDCTVFFEMYHVSRQSFLYLKSFYIGELAPEDILKLKSSGEGVTASAGFLQSLRSFTTEWRINVQDQVSEKVHKSL